MNHSSSLLLLLFDGKGASIMTDIQRGLPKQTSLYLVKNKAVLDKKIPSLNDRPEKADDLRLS